MFRVFACVAICLLPMSGIAQDRAQTLADIRQDLNILYVEIQRLKGELSTTQGPSVSVAAVLCLNVCKTLKPNCSV